MNKDVFIEFDNVNGKIISCGEDISNYTAHFHCTGDRKKSQTAAV